MHKRKLKQNKTENRVRFLIWALGKCWGKWRKFPALVCAHLPVSRKLSRYNFARKPLDTAQPLYAHGPAPCPVAGKSGLSRLRVQAAFTPPAHGEAQYTECIIFLVTFLFSVVPLFLSKTIIQWTFSLGFLRSLIFFLLPEAHHPLWYIPGRGWRPRKCLENHVG